MRRKCQQENGADGKIRRNHQKLISVFGEKPARGLPKPPPTPQRPDLAAFTCGENAILGLGTRNPPAALRRGEKGRGEN
jgi:hypothetical protein